MKRYCRTDLACEAMPSDNALPDGVEYRREVSETGFEIERMSVSKRAETALGKPCGNYITVHSGRIWELDDTEALSELLANELRTLAKVLTKKEISGSFGVLVAGLGNEAMTPDAIGPETVSRITVTRHLSMLNKPLFESLNCCLVSATAPGVLGNTGIEAAELLTGAVGLAKPDLVIAIDALASRSTERLATTVQLSDSGIRPGSGIGNRRSEISQKSLGVPVISVGVPTVIDSSTMIYDALESAGISELSEKVRQALDAGEGFFVAPKECDLITKSISRLLASSIDRAFGINLSGRA